MTMSSSGLKSRTGLPPPGNHSSSCMTREGIAAGSKLEIPPAVAPSPFQSPNDRLEDSKYRKRFRQRKLERLKNTLILFAVAMGLLWYTRYQTSPSHKLHKLKFTHSDHRDDHDRKHGGRHHDERHSHPQRDDRGNEGEEDDEEDDGRHRRGHRGGHDDNDDHPSRRRKHISSRDDQNRDDYRQRGQGWGPGGADHHKFFGGRHGNDDDEEKSEESEDGEDIMHRRLNELNELEARMVSNSNTTVRWADMSDVPSLPGRDKKRDLLYSGNNKRNVVNNVDRKMHRKFYQVHRPNKNMAWEDEFDAIRDKDVHSRTNYVNYVEHRYSYPEKMYELPPLGQYPKLRTYMEIMETWPQDNLDDPPDILQEDLMHFDFNDPKDMEAALKFRIAKLPFKLINVPEVVAATKKWTDEYLSAQFDSNWGLGGSNGPLSSGKCNEGPDNFFAFFNQGLWNIETLGLPPTRDNDWTFARWAKHAHYADRIGLDPNLPHYYWQSGVPREERYQDRSKWTFVSRDLPSFSSTEANFIQFKPEAQKGIQCRFGERGITAANHYDAGRNMIAMITGAKRYILSPPKACKRLGIVSNKRHASYRHSMLNYGHMNHLDDEEMPEEELEWMKMAGTAEAVSTVVKEGEILYVPTGWFHYITSLQKSAQCNVRSGVDMSGDEYFGGANDIQTDCFPHD